MVATSDKGRNNINPKMKVLFTKELAVLGPVQRKMINEERKR